MELYEPNIYMFPMAIRHKNVLSVVTMLHCMYTPVTHGKLGKQNSEKKSIIISSWIGKTQNMLQIEAEIIIIMLH